MLAGPPIIPYGIDLSSRICIDLSLLADHLELGDMVSLPISKLSSPSGLGTSGCRLKASIREVNICLVDF